MNRVDRLFGILLVLGSKRRVRAQDLADEFEVSLRTIYRDVAALYELGVPVVPLPGEGYELMEGYYLPPLVFTPDEAQALFLGARMLAMQASGKLPDQAEKALTKINAVLPHATRQHIERISQVIEFTLPAARFDLDDPRLVTLQQAIAERRVVKLVYHSYLHDEITEREVEPHRLIYNNDGVWYLSGFCRLRQAVRGFRLDRVEQLTLLKKTFTPRSDPPSEVDLLTLRVRFDTSVVRWVRERQHYGFTREEMLLDGAGVIMEYRVQRLAEIVSWLLGWGASAEPLDPPELREQIRQKAQNLLERLT